MPSQNLVISSLLTCSLTRASGVISDIVAPHFRGKWHICKFDSFMLLVMDLPFDFKAESFLTDKSPKFLQVAAQTQLLGYLGIREMLTSLPRKLGYEQNLSSPPLRGLPLLKLESQVVLAAPIVVDPIQCQFKSIDRKGHGATICKTLSSGYAER